MGNENIIAHHILITAEHVYETTGWCKNRLVDKEGRRCLSGALTVGIVTHCNGWRSPLPYPDDQRYPSSYLSESDLDVERKAIRIAVANVAKAAKEVAAEISGILDPEVVHALEEAGRTAVETDEAIITMFNDHPVTTREDILLAIGKARADT